MLKIAVLVSGGGTNLQAIINAIETNQLTNCTIELVISSNKNAYALQRAKDSNIEALVIDKTAFLHVNEEILKNLRRKKIDLVVLAGYLSILEGTILDVYRNKIINIHPALIPAFCGKDMYGLKVHEAVISSGVKITGCTVHFVNEGIDQGAIILQAPLLVKDDDTPQSLQKRLLKVEHTSLIKTIDLISKKQVEVIGNKTKIKK